MRFEAMVFDFDGTIAQTFAPSPNGTDVNTATREAIGQIFGVTGTEIFDSLGGLKNRAPIELIGALISKDPNLIVLVKKAFESQRFHGFVRSGAGVPLIWPDPEEKECVIALATELFVRAKIAIYIPEIRTWPSGHWPAPCDGIIGCFKRISSHGIPVAILSSGHEFFIKRVFELWGAQCPSVMLTDDDLRGSSLRIEERFKPHVKVFLRLLDVWKEQNHSIATVGVAQMAYVGNDANKDGHLAKNVGAQFVWYNPKGMPLPVGGVKPHLEIQHFNELP